MFNRFMVTAATAALIAGTSLAYAQGTGASKEGSTGGAGMQHSTQSPSTSREGAEHGMKSSQGGEKMQGAQNERAQEKSGTKGQNMKGEKSAQENMKGEKSAQENMKGEKSGHENMKGEKSAQENLKGEKGEKSKSSQYEKNEKSTTGQGREERNERNAQGRDERNGNMKAEGREDRMKSESREGREGRMTTEGRDREGRNGVESRSETTTTGQAGAGARLTTEQRSRITTVIRDQHVAPVNNVNFAVTVGTRVPRDIGFHPLPGEIVSIYPEWRGYEYFLVRDEIVVVDPRTLEIVAVLPA